jgi:hypothetical protein
MRLLAVLFLVACDHEPKPMPDATLLPDACSRVPSNGCCELLPDEAAALQCVYDKASDEADDCATLVCWTSDCQVTRIPFCVRPRT